MVTIGSASGEPVRCGRCADRHPDRPASLLALVDYTGAIWVMRRVSKREISGGDSSGKERAPAPSRRLDSGLQSDIRHAREVWNLEQRLGLARGELSRTIPQRIDTGDRSEIVDLECPRCGVKHRMTAGRLVKRSNRSGVRGFLIGARGSGRLRSGAERTPDSGMQFWIVVPDEDETGMPD